MNALEGGLKGSPSELHSLRNPASTQEGGILFSPRDRFNNLILSVLKTLHSSPRWQSIGRSAVITLTFASSLVGGAPAKAETLRDGSGPGCPPVSDDFKQGFKLLADLIPCQIGKPLEAEHFEPSTGNSLQRTSAGLMVWRKADNWTAYTDGSTTWVNGPVGVQERPNEERFEWEDKPAEVAGVQATPAPRSAPAQESRPAPTPEATAVPAPKLKNLFEATGSVRKQFVLREIININGIEIRGKELLAADYAINVFKTIQRVPEYDTLVKKYIKSLEIYGFNWNGAKSDIAGIAVNDVLGDGANVIVYEQPLVQFGFDTTAAEIVYNAKLAEIAMNGNMAARYPYTPVAGLAPGMDRTFWKNREIAGWEAQKNARQAEIDFATKAKLFPGLVQSYQRFIQSADNSLMSLARN